MVAKDVDCLESGFTNFGCFGERIDFLRLGFGEFHQGCLLVARCNGSP